MLLMVGVDGKLVSQVNQILAEGFTKHREMQYIDYYKTAARR